MEKLRFSFVLLLLFGFLYTANTNPITSLFGKSSDEKAETDEKTDEKAAAAAAAGVTTTTAKAAGETTTTTTATPEPSSSSCGGLKGFLHICDKPEPTEPPKSVKTRSVPDENDSDDDDEKKESQQEMETSPEVSEEMETVAKRQVDDMYPPIFEEVPPMVGDPPAELSEEETKDETKGETKDESKTKKRQSEDSDSDSDSDEDETEEVKEDSRRRRDCRDGDGDYSKDCRKKRELVPTCTHKNCREDTTENQQ